MYSHCQCGAATSLQNTVCWVTQDRMSNQSLLQAGLSLRFETAIAFRQVHSGTPSPVITHMVLYKPANPVTTDLHILLAFTCRSLVIIIFNILTVCYQT